MCASVSLALMVAFLTEGGSCSVRIYWKSKGQPAEEQRDGMPSSLPSAFFRVDFGSLQMSLTLFSVGEGLRRGRVDAHSAIASRDFNTVGYEMDLGACIW